ncbi:acyl-CoA thioesterase [Celeribacter persicus]|jgi:Predicted thioesterase|uniref:4-hydroxybenzoyl-CoA thioesterase n=1 Tax=Celeribacter persicus TaxID=1651082 RepID=A0A2T5H922_9RHOB|nr:thioesterase family protein [Celeribacter persicus]PTQ68055.1 4-hydroxybenzoyl-CoA thioesterase [Celeribacter persicus]
MSEVFTLSRQVEFNHCDPAGIVFYPRYFEMISAVQERFFADALGASWADMTPAGFGTPMGEINVRFAAPSRLGDRLDFTLEIARLGGASAELAITCHSAGELRFTCRATIVHVSLAETKSARWPEALRGKMTAYLQDQRKKTA